MSSSFAPHENGLAPGPVTPWLVCVETQRLHFAPDQGPVVEPFYAKVEACRRVLGYARRNHWQVAHVHRRRLETSTGKSDPELRPIEGLEPLPTERVYVRQINRPVTLRDDPFWRDTLSARGADILMVGHLTLQAIADVASTAQNVGLDVMMVEDAIWRRHPNTPFDGSALSLFALKRMQSAQVRQTSEYRQALSLHGPANTP